MCYTNDNEFQVLCFDELDDMDLKEFADDMLPTEERGY